MLLTPDEILIILDRLKWEPMFRDGQTILCKHRGTGYSSDPLFSGLEAKLSMMLAVAGSRPSTPEERKAIEAGKEKFLRGQK